MRQLSTQTLDRCILKRLMKRVLESLIDRLNAKSSLPGSLQVILRNMVNILLQELILSNRGEVATCVPVDGDISWCGGYCVPFGFHQRAVGGTKNCVPQRARSRVLLSVP